MAFDIIRETTIDIVNSSLSSIKLPAWDILKFILPMTSKNMQTKLLLYPKYMAYETILSGVRFIYATLIYSHFDRYMSVYQFRWYNRTVPDGK